MRVVRGDTNDRIDARNGGHSTDTGSAGRTNDSRRSGSTERHSIVAERSGERPEAGE
jgi:hypothetical protein